MAHDGSTWSAISRTGESTVLAFDVTLDSQFRVIPLDHITALPQLFRIHFSMYLLRVIWMAFPLSGKALP